MQKTPLAVGITGGIGAGKTTVTHIFQTLGIPIYYADIQAKILMETDDDLIEKVIGIFGREAYDDEGRCNRHWIADLAFKDKNKLHALNAVVHPVVAADTECWQSLWQDVPYTLRESALLFETDSWKYVDKTICVTAPLPLRIERVKQRNGWTEERIRSIISEQLPDEEKIQRADFVIHNDGIQHLIGQVLNIHRSIIGVV